jgi:hypothetical protein
MGISGCICGIKTDGTLWTWGWNSYGQIGDGTTVHRSSPVQTLTKDKLWMRLLNQTSTYAGAIRQYTPYTLNYDVSTANVSNTTIADISGLENNGTMTSSAMFNLGCPNTLGFDSTREITTTISQNNPQVYTLSVWFKTTSASGKKIIGHENNQTGTGSGNYSRHLYIGTNGQLYFATSANGTGYTITSSTIVCDGAWHHAVISAKSGAQRLFIDGVLVGSDTKSVANPVGDNVNGWWRIGGYKLTGWTNGSDGYFTGDIGKAAVYKIALTDVEITSLYAAELPLFNVAKFSYTGSLQTWTVPSGVYNIDATIIGAKGGDNTTGGSVGGGGAIMYTNIDVTPGQTLYLVVGGYPGTSETPAYGFGGAGQAPSSGLQRTGAAGGGLSGIFTSNSFLPSTVLAIAAGGGGANGRSSATGGGNGGNPNGSNGGEYNSSFGANAGWGANQSQPGNAGSQYDGYVTLPQQGAYLYGGAGSKFEGTGAGNQGAGGGAGYYGGGGGASGGDATGGAGGGSSYSVGSVTYGPIANTLGNGSIVITYGCSYAVGQNLLWAWGDNSGGNLGAGSVSSKSLPIPVKYNTTWSNIGGA